MAQLKDLIVNGVGRFIGKIYASEFIGKLTGNADTATSATKATQDESGNNIKASYASSIGISDHTITLKNKNGASLGTVTVPDNNTWRGIQDNLTSNSTTDSLSAAQGKVLKGLVDGKASSSHSHDYVPLSGNSTVNGAITFGKSDDYGIRTNTNDYGRIGDSTNQFYEVYSKVIYEDKTKLTNKYAPISHTHTKSQITDFPTSLPASDVYSWAKASSKPSYSWSEITSKPSTFTPSTHDHNSIYYTKAQVDAADLVLENGLSTLSTGKADYEPGTWSPTISNSSVSCLEEKSPYVKIGSIVLLWTVVDVNTTNMFGVNGFPISMKSMLSACIFDIDASDDYNSGKLIRDGSAYHVYFQCPTGCKRIFIIYSC